MFTASEAKKVIKTEAARLGLKYGKMQGKTQYFDGSPAVCVTLHDCVPNPLWEDLRIFARGQKIVVSIYVNGISAR